jgi:ABC-type uncharacterized transport system permease subunit
MWFFLDNSLIRRPIVAKFSIQINDIGIYAVTKIEIKLSFLSEKIKEIEWSNTFEPQNN